MGPSGAGKTTAAQLIPKFWETRQGAVRIDGHALSELRTDNLMDLVSFVFQEAFMLDDTLYRTSGSADRTPRASRWRPPRGPRRSTTRSRACRTATTRCWERTASSCPAASGSACASLAPS
ncbi:MAG: ATP-binding cassette domain-containing protein [Eggerthellaceae bacterium]